MASKINYQSKGDFNPSTDLDLPDFEFDVEKPKSNGEVVTGLGKTVARSAGNAIFSTNTLEQIIRRALPKSYGETLDYMSEASSNIKSLYNTAVKELRPANSQLKQSIRTILPNLKDKVPGSIADRLKEYSKVDSTYSSELSPEQQREQALMIELGNMFQSQAEQNHEGQVREDQREQLRQALDQVRHKDNLGQLNAIRVGIGRLTSYQDNVLANYQKKSLELQYRQYYATAEILKTLKQTQVENKAAYEGIITNTSLPEFVKLSASKRFKEMARNRFMEAGQDALFGRTDYIRKYMTNITNSLKEKIKQYAEAGNDMTDMLSMGTDMASMGSDMGMDFKDILAEQVGGFMGNEYVNSKIPGIRKLANKNKRIVRFGNKLAYGINNAPHLIKNSLNDYDKFKWMSDDLRNFLLETMPNIEGGVNMDVDKATSMMDVGYTSKGVNKSLTEVIPGLLSRIHREMYILRTGNENVGLLAYDFEKNKFADSKQLAKDIRRSMVSSDERKTISDKTNKLVRFLGKAGGGNLSDSQKKLLSDKLIEMSFRRRDTDFSALGMKSSTWGGGEDAKQLNNLFRNLFGYDGVDEMNNPIFKNKDIQAKAQNMITQSIQDLTGHLRDPRARIQNMVNLGQYDVLREAGLLNDANELDRNALYQEMLGEYETVQTPTGERRRRRRLNIKNDNRQFTTYNQSIGSQANSTESESVSVNRGMEELTESIKSTSIVPQANQMAASLLRIEQAINESILIQASKLSDKELDGLSAESRKRKGWWNKTLGEATKDTFSGVFNFGGSLFKHAKTVSKRLETILGRSASAGFNVGKKTFQMGAGILDKFLGDVYVGDEKSPRLTKAALKAGEYIDQKTGKIIKSFKDITGTVIDKTGSVLLDASEIENSFVKGNKLRALGSLVGNVGKFAFGELGSSLGRAAKIGSIAFSKFKSGSASIAKMIIPVKDIYLKGEIDKDPILFRWKMIKGYYFSKKTGKVIRHQNDIDGPVIEMKDGVETVVLTEEMINQGLVDSMGKEIRSLYMNAVGRLAKMGFAAGKTILSKAVKLAKGIGENLTAGASSLLKGLGSIFGGFTFMGKKNYEVNKSALDVQKAILKLLQERLPGRKKVFGDLDGDGIREGSYEDLQRKKSKAQQAKESLSSKMGSASGLNIAGMFGGLTGAFSGIKNMFSKSPKEKESDDSLGVGDIAAGVAGGSVGGGILGKFRGKLASGAKLLGKGALGIGRLGLSALGMTGGAGLSAVTAGAGLLARGGAAALGLISWPVALTALGLTAAYYGYKQYKKKRIDTLSAVRFAQYGFDASEEEALQAVFGLEDGLQKHVEINAGKGKINEDKVDFEELISAFGVSLDDKKAYSKWKAWYEARFKPVFLGHMAVLRTSYPGVDIDSVDSKLDSQSKLKYLDATQLLGVDYGFVVSPFAGARVLKISVQGVKGAIEIARAKLQKEIKDKADYKPGLLETKARELTAGALSAVGMKSAADKIMEPLLKKDKDDSVVKAVKQSIEASSSVSANYIQITKDRLSALQAIRFKLYGLTEMKREQVKALMDLEVSVFPLISFNDKSAEFTGNGVQVLDAVKSNFGISGYSSPRGYKWMSWFRKRFLPVYLNYLQAMKLATGKTTQGDGEAIIKPDQQISVANAMKSSVSPDGVSVWEVLDSPWEDLIVNTSPESVDLNMKALVEVSKAQVLGQVSKTANEQEKKIAAYKAANPPKPTGNIVKDTYNSAVNRFTNNTPYKSIDSSGRGVNAVGDFGSGVTIQHPGKGTGGDINKISMPAGSGYDNLKNTIAEVAKMVGVDNNLLTAMTAIESGFKIDARPIDKSGRLLSSAVGLLQIIDGTWNKLIEKYGAKYGIAPGTPKTDPRANLLLGAEYIRENVEFLKGKVGRALTNTDVYLAHFLGPGGAAKFLKADPSAVASQILPDAAKSNPSVFFDKETGRPFTVSEIYSTFTNKLSNRLSKLGISVQTQTASLKAPNSGLSEVKQTVVGEIAIPTPKVAAVAAVNPVVSGYGSNVASVQNQTKPTVPSVNQSFAGFDRSPSPSSREIEQQVIANKSIMNDRMDRVSKTLESSLAVQTEIRDAVLKILPQILMRDKSTSQSVSNNASPTTTTKEATKPIVSMRRSN